MPVMNFIVCPIQCKVDERLGKRLGLCILISAQPLIESSLWECSKSSPIYVGVGGSVKSIIASYGGRLSEYTSLRFVMSAAEQ